MGWTGSPRRRGANRGCHPGGASERPRSRPGRRSEPRLEADLGLEALREQLLVDLAGLGEVALRHLPARDAPAQSSGNVPQPSLIGGGLPVPGAEAPLQTHIRRRRGGRPPASRARSAGRGAPLDQRSGPRRRDQRHAPGPAAPAVPRSWSRQPVRGGGVPGAPNAAGGPRNATGRPGPGDRADASADRGGADQPDHRTVPDHLPGPRGRLRRTVPAVLRGRVRQAGAHRSADLGSTGVEITARPPGKKKQPLGCSPVASAP